MLGNLVAVWRISSRLVAFKRLQNSDAPSQTPVHPAESIPANDSSSNVATPQSIAAGLKLALTDLIRGMPTLDKFVRSMADPGRNVREQKAPLGWSLAYLPYVEAQLRDELAIPLWLRIKRRLWKAIQNLSYYIDE